MCKILANMTQVSDVAPGPLVPLYAVIRSRFFALVYYLCIFCCEHHIVYNKPLDDTSFFNIAMMFYLDSMEVIHSTRGFEVH
jgi:hypothetical protein